MNVNCLANSSDNSFLETKRGHAIVPCVGEKRNGGNVFSPTTSWFSYLFSFLIHITVIVFLLYWVLTWFQPPWTLALFLSGGMFCDEQLKPAHRGSRFCVGLVGEWVVETPTVSVGQWWVPLVQSGRHGHTQVCSCSLFSARTPLFTLFLTVMYACSFFSFFDNSVIWSPVSS